MTTTDEFAEQLFGDALGAFNVMSIYVGEKLGAYEALAQHGPQTVAELATRVHAHERYVREWAEQQAASSILACLNPDDPPAERRFELPPGHADVLCNRDSLAYLAPFVRMVVGAGMQMEPLLAAYRTGGGVSWAQFGDDMRSGQAEMNRPWFLTALGSEWFPAVPQLELGPGRRVADIGCGEGWSSIAIAEAYPGVIVDGFDLDGPSIDHARANAKARRVADRVTFHHADASGLREAGGYDLVTAFECIHDMSDPVGALTTMRRLAAPGGRVIVMDEAVGEQFTGAADEIERLFYGFSLFVCLPDGMSHQPSAGTGTVMRPSTLAGYATDAGFTRVDVLPVENDLWRFYELVV